MPTSSGEEEEYEVENITEARVEKDKGRKKNLIWKYNVRWKGYGPQDDTWEPVASFVGSEHMIEQFWQRANSGGRDYRDLSLFRAGEGFVRTGPPRHKPKQKSLKSGTAVSSQESPHPSSSAVPEPGPSRSDKRRRSPTDVIEIVDSDDERPNKRPREHNEPTEPSGTSISLPGRSKKKARGTAVSLTTNPRISPKKNTRAPSYDEVIPASDDELAEMYQPETSKATPRKLGTSDGGPKVLESMEGDGLDGGATKEPLQQDNPAMMMQVDSDTGPDVSKNLPAHRAKAANPKVKRAELNFAAQDGALSVKARFLGRDATLSTAATSSPSRRKAGSKPGPGRSSSGFMKNTSSLLTYNKGELMTVKGHYRKEEPEKVNTPPSMDHGRLDSPPTDTLWGGDDEIDDNGYANTAAPTANELLHLAGADLSQEPLPDFEDDAPVVTPSIPDSVPPNPLPVASPPAETEPQDALTSQAELTRPVHQESLERAKNSLFPSSASPVLNAHAPAWKQPTMFGPLGFGSNSQTAEVVQSETVQSPPFYINLDSSVSIPVVLTDVVPSQPGSPSLEFIVANKGPPGVFYNQKAALALLDTLRTSGPSAKIGLHASATPDHKSDFERFCSRLSVGELYAGMAGDEFLAFCSSDDALLSQRLNITPQLLGRPGDVFIERVVIENYSAYAEAALAGDNRRWPG